MASGPVQIIDAAWNDAAASRIQALVAGGKFQYTLPELRIYDAGRKLIFRQIGDSPTIDNAALKRVISADRPISGPTFAETVADLDTADHQSAAAKLPANGEVTIVDYWAEWCASCKVLGKRLTTWAATQPQGSVRIVKAEADLQKLLAKAQPANGQTVVKRVSSVSKDGKVHTVVTRTVTTTVNPKRS
ncbi:MAG TPA: thioredoxin family protein [Sphingomicrobium sp.]|nr:thioredoxin family protein [Sphingomicrobium sp.]